MSTQSKPKKTRRRPEPLEPPDDTEYEDAMKPLLWLLIPLVAIIVYGYFT